MAAKICLDLLSERRLIMLEDIIYYVDRNPEKSWIAAITFSLHIYCENKVLS